MNTLLVTCEDTPFQKLPVALGLACGVIRTDWSRNSAVYVSQVLVPFQLQKVTAWGSCITVFTKSTEGKN